MTTIDCAGMGFEELGRKLRAESGDISLKNCLGQRFIGAGRSSGSIDICGIPGNALGAYLDGAEIRVHGSAQDATGDTMNAGRIVVEGSVGDAAGYAMRGGEIYVRGNAGYRAGIHMKAYRDRRPTIIIGGTAGSFLGEYQAGGVIIVLGLEAGGESPLGPFCGTGMHGGAIYVRADKPPENLPAHVAAREISEEELMQIMPQISSFCGLFGVSEDDIVKKRLFAVKPQGPDPYKQLYVRN